MFPAAVMALTAMVFLALAPNANAESAKDNYSLMCVQCHGTAGTGKGINAPFLSVAPRNHTSAKDMGSLSDDNVFKAIKEGGVAVGKSTQMPSFAAILTDAEIQDIVRLLREMCKCEGIKI
jgi:mono/diheme cytochrome c family protein